MTQELAGLLDTPYAHFQVDEVDSRVVAWEAVRSTCIALHVPAGTDSTLQQSDDCKNMDCSLRPT